MHCRNGPQKHAFLYIGIAGGFAVAREEEAAADSGHGAATDRAASGVRAADGVHGGCPGAA